MNNRAVSGAVSATIAVAVIHPAFGGIYYLNTAHPRPALAGRGIRGQIINKLILI